jgi:hypothetical protein
VTALENLPSLAARLRQEIAVGNYRDAETLLAAYRAQVEFAVRELSCDRRRASALAEEAVSLLRWADRTVRAARSHAADQYGQLSSVSSFQTAGLSGKTWEFEG